MTSLSTSTAGAGPTCPDRHDPPLPKAAPGAYRLLLAAVLAQVAISFVELGVPVLAPFIKEGLGLSAAGVGAVVSSLNVGRILGSIPSGRLVDSLGERTVMVFGGVGVAAFAGLAAISPYVPLLFALVVTGVFAGSASPAGSALILSAFPAHRRGLPMGIRQAAVPVGALFAAASLPALADATNWRVALGAAAVVPVLGSVVCRAAMRNAPARSVGVGNAASGLGTVLRDRRIVLAGLWAMLFVGGQYGVLVYLVLDLTTEVRLSLATAVTLLAAATAAGAAGRMGWGWLSDHAFGGRRRPGLVLVTVSGGASAALLATLGAGTPTWVAAIAAVVGGFSLLGWQGLWIALVSEMAPAGRAGTAIGFGLTFTNAGIVLWPPLFGAIADLSGSFRWSWLMLAGAIVGSLAVLLAIDEATA